MLSKINKDIDRLVCLFFITYCYHATNKRSSCEIAGMLPLERSVMPAAGKLFSYAGRGYCYSFFPQ